MWMRTEGASALKEFHISFCAKVIDDWAAYTSDVIFISSLSLSLLTPAVPALLGSHPLSAGLRWNLDKQRLRRKQNSAELTHQIISNGAVLQEHELIPLFLSPPIIPPKNPRSVLNSFVLSFLRSRPNFSQDEQLVVYMFTLLSLRDDPEKNKKCRQ